MLISEFIKKLNWRSCTSGEGEETVTSFECDLKHSFVEYPLSCTACNFVKVCLSSYEERYEERVSDSKGVWGEVWSEWKDSKLVLEGMGVVWLEESEVEVENDMELGIWDCNASNKSSFMSKRSAKLSTRNDAGLGTWKRKRLCSIVINTYINTSINTRTRVNKYFHIKRWTGWRAPWTHRFCWGHHQFH